MKRTLKEIYSLREMSVTIPDEDVAQFMDAIDSAIKAGKLPPSAKNWMPTSPGGRKPIGAPPSIAKKQSTSKPPTPNVDAGTDKAVSAWDSFAPKSAKKPAATPGKAEPQPKLGDFPSFPAPPSANVQVGSGDEFEDNYKSHFKWDAIDPTGTANTPVIPDRNTGGWRDLDQSTPEKPGLAARASAGLKNVFKKKPTDGRKELDKALQSFDKKANSKQGTLSKIFKGKDVTR